MYRIQTVNKISQDGLSRLDNTQFLLGDDVTDPDGILVRSADLHSTTFAPSLRAIARAGAGTNNIPLDRCSQEGIVVFNTPGANANAVKELVLCAMLVSSRDVFGGIEWTKTTAKEVGADLPKAVEQGKSTFAGPEIAGKTIGILGLGAIGVRVANACYRLGMEVIGYDPYLSVNAALQLDRHIQVVTQVEDLYRNADYITIHVPYLPSTKDTINAAAIEKMKGSVRIINLARGELVNQEDIIAALESGRVARYVTDFPTQEIMGVKNVIALPHLGASTPDSEKNCAIMAANQLRDYLVHGNITNSVNFPDVAMDRSGLSRLCLIHQNIPAMLSQITNALSQEKVNVENLLNKSKGDFAYTLLDMNTRMEQESANKLRDIQGMIRVRLLRH